MDCPSKSEPRAARRNLILAAVLFFVTLAVFWPARRYDFINLDDHRYILSNPMVTDGLSLHSVREAFTTVHEQWWLPLLWISYMADIDLFGPAPYGHHLVNILLHAGNTALLFWVLAVMTGARWRSAFVAALFAVHPTRVEAVVWIAARKDVLSGLFFMLGLLAYLRHVRQPSARRMVPVFLLMLAGLMSKAILVVFPVLLLLLDVWPLRRLRLEWTPQARRTALRLLREKAALFGLAAVFVAVNLWTHVTGRGDSLAPLHRLALIPPNIFAYLGKLAAPLRLSFFYPENDIVSWPIAMAAAVVLLAFTWVLFRRRKQAPAVLVGWLWFLVALAPILRGVRLGLAQYADRWTYLPLIGIGIALAWAVPPLPVGSRRRAWIPATAAVLVLAACVTLTRAQLPFWRDTLTIYRRGVTLAPESPFLQSLYGQYLFKAGRTREAANHLQKALELDPDHIESHSLYGMALTSLGRPAEALAFHDEAVRLDPHVAEYHCRRGNALLLLGRRPEARTAYEETLRLEPGHPEASFNLANLLVEAGETETALPLYEAAARARPDVALTWLQWGLACEDLGRRADALAHVERALAIQPGLGPAILAAARLRADPTP